MVESEARFKMQEHQVQCEPACDGMSEAEIDEMFRAVPVERSVVVGARD
jgi:hypothetical protein